MSGKYLQIRGAKLYYEATGKGPLLLCISGGDGSCETWKNFADCLQNRFTVVAWDRRGFSRSILLGAQNYEQRLETDADDAAQLIRHLSPSEPATVIGSSSGAIVAMKLLGRHPNIIRMLIAHEPPYARVLPDYRELQQQLQDVYDTYRRSGIPPALGQLARLTQGDQTITLNLIDFTKPYLFSNTQYWFEREFNTYEMSNLNIEAELQPAMDKLMLVVGEWSPQEAYQVRANTVIAQKLGLQVTILPGDHNGHVLNAPQFTENLFQVLKTRDTFYKAL